eukprot:7354855-Pyramimonas_sp.AAC.2
MRVVSLGIAPIFPDRRPALLPDHGQGNYGRWGMVRSIRPSRPWRPTFEPDACSLLLWAPWPRSVVDSVGYPSFQLLFGMAAGASHIPAW